MALRPVGYKHVQDLIDAAIAAVEGAAPPDADSLNELLGKINALRIGPDATDNGIDVRSADGSTNFRVGDRDGAVNFVFTEGNLATAVTLIAAAGSGIRNYLTSLHVMAEALTNATELAIRDGAAGTVIWRTKIGTAGLTNGITINFPTPLKGTANTLMEIVTLTASGAGAVYVNAQGYQAP